MKLPYVDHWRNSDRTLVFLERIFDNKTWSSMTSKWTHRARNERTNERKYIKNTITNPPFDIRGVVYHEIEPLGKNRPVQNFGNT